MPVRLTRSGCYTREKAPALVTESIARACVAGSHLMWVAYQRVAAPRS